MSTEPHHQSRAEAVDAAARSADFALLRRNYRGFAFPMTVVFLLWYFAFVLCAVFASSWMATPVWGNINIGITFGLLQFVSTALITWLYVRHARTKLDPLAERLREEIEGVHHGG